MWEGAKLASCDQLIQPVWAESCASTKTFIHWCWYDFLPTIGTGSADPSGQYFADDVIILYAYLCCLLSLIYPFGAYSMKCKVHVMFQPMCSLEYSSFAPSFMSRPKKTLQTQEYSKSALILIPYVQPIPVRVPPIDEDKEAAVVQGLKKELNYM